jgi:hypothetical protein
LTVECLVSVGLTAGYPFQSRDDFQRWDVCLGVSQAAYSDACWGVRPMVDWLTGAMTAG